jgi:hypothetical protein
MSALSLQGLTILEHTHQASLFDFPLDMFSMCCLHPLIETARETRCLRWST